MQEDEWPMPPVAIVPILWFSIGERIKAMQLMGSRLRLAMKEVEPKVAKVEHSSEKSKRADRSRWETSVPPNIAEGLHKDRKN